MPDVPKNAKKPSDHVTKDEAKAAKDEALGKPIKIWWTYPAPTDEDPDATEETSFEIDREVANDFEIMELSTDMNDAVDDGDDTLAAMLSVKMLRKLLSRGEFKRLKATVTDEHGRVDPERMFEFFGRANEAMGNSVASPGS